MDRNATKRRLERPVTQASNLLLPMPLHTDRQTHTHTHSSHVFLVFGPFNMKHSGSNLKPFASLVMQAFVSRERSSLCC